MIPASAGPTDRDTFIPNVFNPMAARSSARLTNSGVIAPHAGIIIAVPIPSAKVNINSTEAVVNPDKVSTPRVAAVSIIQNCDAIR